MVKQNQATGPARPRPARRYRLQPHRRAGHRDQLALPLEAVENSAGVQSRAPVIVHHAPLRAIDADGRVGRVLDQLANVIPHVGLIAARILDEILLVHNPVIVVDAQVVEVLGALVQQLLVPSVRAALAIVVAIAAACDDLEGGILAAQRLAELANHLGIAFGPHAPGLVVDLPQLHMIGLGMPVVGTRGTPLCAGVAVAIFEPVQCFLHAQAHVHRQNRFGTHPPAQVHELIRAHLVRVLIGPDHVREVGAVDARADSILPTIGRSKAATGVADSGRLEVLDRLQHLRTEPALVQRALREQIEHVQ